jgi:phosphinothricin acetyltransferase
LHRGIGRALYSALLDVVTELGYSTAVAGITLPNPASVAFHESLGFTPVGTYRHVGYKHGQWWDVGWWQKLLQPLARTPAEPRTLGEVKSG